MGRELRKVTADWEHPRDSNGNYKPLLGDSYRKSLTEWQEGRQKWEEGFRKAWFFQEGREKWVPKVEDEMEISWEEWVGEIPKKCDYMPDWEDEDRTNIQMYEDTTEGTPISPVMKDPEELARWLVDNNTSAFADLTATYEQWLNTINEGYAPSAILISGVLDSGVANLLKVKNNE